MSYLDDSDRSDDYDEFTPMMERLYGPLEVRSLTEGTDRPDEIVIARRALIPIQQSLTDAGFYAYGTFDDQHRWTIAVDDEAGRVDVRIGPDGFVVELWASSPGLFADEENEWRRRAQERLARMVIPNITQGQLQPHQSASWDATDHGVAVRLSYELPFTQVETVGTFVREHLPELDELLTYVESRVVS